MKGYCRVTLPRPTHFETQNLGPSEPCISIILQVCGPCRPGAACGSAASGHLR